MSGFQFVHLETYGRRGVKDSRTVSYVLAEAARLAGAHPHVEAPLPPRILHGVEPSEVQGLHDSAVDSAVAVTVAGKSRKIRVDQHTLLTVVASHPNRTEEVRADDDKRKEVDAWAERVRSWALQLYGDQVASIVMHEDEAFPNIHILVLSNDPQCRAKLLHLGVAAKVKAVDEARSQGLDSKDSNKAGDRAYREAMREWQDQYWRKVGLPSGLARLGPGRRRLTRDEWRAEQAAVTAAAVARADAAASAAAADRARELERVAIEAAERAKVAADEAEARARDLRQRAAEYVEKVRRQAADYSERQRKRADALVRRAQREAERILAPARRAGGWVGALVERMRHGPASERVAAAIAAEREAAERERLRLEAAAERERREREAAERRAENLRSAVHQVSDRADRLAAELDRLHPDPGRRPAPRRG